MGRSAEGSSFIVEQQEPCLEGHMLAIRCPESGLKQGSATFLITTHRQRRTHLLYKTTVRTKSVCRDILARQEYFTHHVRIWKSQYVWHSSIEDIVFLRGLCYGAKPKDSVSNDCGCRMYRTYNIVILPYGRRGGRVESARVHIARSMSSRETRLLDI